MVPLQYTVHPNFHFYSTIAGIQEFWLGGNDLDSEGHWVWAGHNKTITSSDYTNWVSHVYRNVLQNCMSMTEAYRWMTEPCYYERVPICQLKLN